MRIVLDTNVLVSAALKRQSMPGMAALMVERRGGLLRSLVTEQQLFEIVARPYLAKLIDALADVHPLGRRHQLAQPGPRRRIVTGDGDLLVLAALVRDFAR
jgi:predicted nucleic acid-binding protein